ncbi:MAG: response regulator [Thermomonas sp.]
MTAVNDRGEAPVNILLVDDQPGRLLTYRAILEPLGEVLVEARSGEEALTQLMADEFALILLDVNMPGMDGFETASLIHQHPRFEKTPIIFVTAVNVTDMDRLRGYKLGAVDYVMVPVIPEILRSKVMVLAELHRKRRELQASNTQLAAANDALQAEQARELAVLNDSLRHANAALASQNVALHKEIAERSRVEKLLRDADSRKDEFLATLAHELRNPLAPLQNALSIRRLAGGEQPDALQGLMERQLALLVRLIDDLLDIARITRSKLELRKELTTLRNIIDCAIETAKPTIEQRGHSLTVDLPDTQVALNADPVRLSQVFANLLTNAAKYSEPGGRIALTTHVTENAVLVEVHDAGIGLAAGDLERIFELFSQVDSSIERAHGGLGIGLTLVRQLTEMHGGQVSVVSEGLGFGSTFSISLPREALPAPANALDVAGSTGAYPDRRKRVLVVDDNRDAAQTLAMMIELLGHDVRWLSDPYAVIAEIASFHPEIVFLDVGMPGLSGYELTRQLRRLPGGAELLVVAVTGWGQPADRARTRESGFDEHLVKPPAMEAIITLCGDANATPQSSRGLGNG